LFSRHVDICVMVILKDFYVHKHKLVVVSSSYKYNVRPFDLCALQRGIMPHSSINNNLTKHDVYSRP
jgi:hypothetical protein